MKKLNLYLIEYAVGSLLRQKHKTIFLLSVFFLLTFLLTAVFFIANSIKYELNTTVESLPEITIQNVKGGRVYDISSELLDEIYHITGVSDVIERVWGYYYFESAGVNFSIVGIDRFAEQYKKSFNGIVQKLDEIDNENEAFMIVGEGVKKVMQESYYDNYFNFIRADGSFKKMTIAGVFDGMTKLESNDIIAMSIDDARDILGIDEYMATDMVVKVANPEEIATIVSKIQTLYPNTRIITKDELKAGYQNIFDYKSGIFLALFIVSLFTFFIIVYDKISGLSSEEKKEIGILKAIGWKSEDILKEKFLEAFIVSFISYISGVIAALSFVYIFQAPVLRDIFIGYSNIKVDFELPFIFDIQTLIIVFLLSIPVYIGATIIPSWRVSTLETDEIIR